jgi:hypothetical protein
MNNFIKSLNKNKTNYKHTLSADDLKFFKLSENYKKRLLEDSLKLYANIEGCVYMAQQGDEYANTYLFFIMLPFLKRVSHSIQYYAIKLNVSIDYKDVFQQAYIYFNHYLMKYDPTKNISFLNYIKKILFLKLRRWRNKEIENITGMYTYYPDVILNNNKDTTLGHVISNEMISNIYNIIEEKRKKARSLTVIKVIDDVIFGSKNIREVSRELNVSYHAAYEIYRKILNSIAYYVNQDKECRYYVDKFSDGTKPYALVKKTL